MLSSAGACRLQVGLQARQRLALAVRDDFRNWLIRAA
jgi:hypothetical protein